MGRSVAHTVSRLASHRGGPRSNPGRVGFVVDKATLDRLPPITSFPCQAFSTPVPHLSSFGDGTIGK
jgi:hypothetical protein